MVGYRFDVFSRGGWSFFTGPELRIGFTGKECDDDGHSIDIYGDEGWANQVDCAWNVGTGINIDKFYVGFTASLGMADMIMVSGAGDVAVSGVSLVNTISNLHV